MRGMTELEADTQQAAPFSRRESGGEWGEVILSLTDGTPLGHPHRGGWFSNTHPCTFQGEEESKTIGYCSPRSPAEK